MLPPICFGMEYITIYDPETEVLPRRGAAEREDGPGRFAYGTEAVNMNYGGYASGSLDVGR